jgi:hypothetical protein
MSWDWTLLLVADASLLMLATLGVVLLFLRDLGRRRADGDSGSPAPADRSDDHAGLEEEVRRET